MAHYDPAQDRMLLRLKDPASKDETALWLTRRQWTQIAVACDRMRAMNAGEDKSARAGSDTTAARPRAASQGEGRAAAAAARLVSSVKFRRVPSGVRIDLATDAPAPLSLVLKGESLAFFLDLVERLATKAKWDLPAALARMKSQPPAPKRMLH